MPKKFKPRIDTDIWSKVSAKCLLWRVVMFWSLANEILFMQTTRASSDSRKTKHCDIAPETLCLSRYIMRIVGPAQEIGYIQSIEKQMDRDRTETGIKVTYIVKILIYICRKKKTISFLYKLILIHQYYGRYHSVFTNSHSSCNCKNKYCLHFCP